jgi:hypothetical protein
VEGDRGRLDTRIPAPSQPALRRGVSRGRPRRAQLGAGRRGPGSAIDEYERLLERPTRQPRAPEGHKRSEDPNYQRLLGLALANTDAACSILIRCRELNHDYAREAMEGGERSSAERTFRIYGS